MRINWTIELIEKRLVELFGDKVILAPNQEYKGTGAKMLFIDNDYGEWESYLGNVLKGYGNRKRGTAENTKNPFKNPEFQKNLQEKRLQETGYRTPLENPEIRTKAAQTYFSKHGVDNPFKNPEEQQKGVETRVEKYGIEYAQQSEEIKKKTEETCRERYGVTKFLSSPEVREQIKSTCQDKFGGSAPLCGADIKEKVKTTCLEKYGVDNPSGLWYNTFLEEFQIWYVAKPRRYCVYMLTERFIKEDSNPEELWVKCFKKLEEFEQYLKSRRML